MTYKDPQELSLLEVISESQRAGMITRGTRTCWAPIQAKKMVKKTVAVNLVPRSLGHTCKYLYTSA